jgi:hypothetical protein
MDLDAIPTIDDVEIQIGGVCFRLGDVAEISVWGNLE